MIEEYTSEVAVGKPIPEDTNDFQDLQGIGHGHVVTNAVPINDFGSKAMKVNSMD